MNLILGLDFETTGLSFENDRITEVGAVLWDTEARVPVQIFNALVRHRDGPPISAEIEALTGISQAMLDRFGEPANSVFAHLDGLLSHAVAVVAHNGNGFDRPMWEAQIKRSDPEMELSMRDLPWIDTCMDLPFPEKMVTRKLTHLAAEHGFLNPFAHRAVFDVLTMLKVLDSYPFDGVLESARQPMVTLQACVSIEDREKAKVRGYRWKPERRQWLRHFKAHQVEKEVRECGFRVNQLPFTP